MVMIRCPECGQRVLDVASSCPKCGHVLIQNPLETHGWGNLEACGRCGKHIERDLAICPYCGHHVRAARLATRIALGVAAAVVVVIAAVLLWRAGVLGSLREAARPAPRAAPAVARPEAAAPVAAPSVPDSVTTAPILVVSPETATRDTVGTATPAPSRAPGPRPRDLVTRWTLEWANVRAARSMESSVVQVLPPGRAVEVREMRQGWWAVHADGTVVGYIANSVLGTAPPG